MCTSRPAAAPLHLAESWRVHSLPGCGQAEIHECWTSTLTRTMHTNMRPPCSSTTGGLTTGAGDDELRAQLANAALEDKRKAQVGAWGVSLLPSELHLCALLFKMVCGKCVHTYEHIIVCSFVPTAPCVVL